MHRISDLELCIHSQRLSLSDQSLSSSQIGPSPSENNLFLNNQTA